MCPESKREGFALLYAVFLIVFLSFVGAIVVALLSSTSRVASENLLYSEALYCAESGKEIAIMRCLEGFCNSDTYTFGGNRINVVFLSSTPLPDGHTLYTATSRCTMRIDGIKREIEFKFWK